MSRLGATQGVFVKKIAALLLGTVIIAGAQRRAPQHARDHWESDYNHPHLGLKFQAPTDMIGVPLFNRHHNTG
jgi:hypothetical protein